MTWRLEMYDESMYESFPSLVVLAVIKDFDIWTIADKEMYNILRLNRIMLKAHQLLSPGFLL